MPFGIDVDLERVKSTINDTLKEFGIGYTKAFAIALVQKVIDDAAEEKEEPSPYQLTQVPEPTAPTIEGDLKRQSTVLGRWKEAYFWIQDDYTVAYGNKDKKDKPDGTMNLWGYKVQGITHKPEGPRKGGPDWIPDEERPNCVLCNKAFSMTVWHHHCRNCGEVFCSDCAGNKASLNQFGYEKPQRVCNTCFEKVGRTRANTFAVTDQEAKEDDNFHGVQLLHVSRTPYVLQCANLQEKEAWAEALKECAKRAGPPINPDPVQAAAFEEAHRNAAWAARMWGRWSITGDEGEMISDVIAHVVDREVVSPAIRNADDKIPPKLKRMATNTINKQVLTLVRAAVGPGWTAISAGVTKTQEVLEEKIKPIIQPIAEAKNKVMDDLQGKIMEHVNPLLEKVGKVVLNLVLELAMEPVIAAHAASYEALNTVVGGLAIKSTDKAAFDKAIAEYARNLRRYRGPLSAVHDKLSDLRSELRKKQREGDLLDYLPVSKTIGDITDSIQKVCDNALYTLQNHASLAENASEDAVKAAWKEIVPKVLNDSQVSLIITIKEIIAVAVVGPLQEKLLQNEALNAILEPIDSSLPDAVSEFISVGGLLEDLVGNVCAEAIDTAVDAGSDDSKKSLAASMTAQSLS